MSGEGFQRAVVLLSGGLDSATALAVALRDGFEPVTLAVDYGQRHRRELDGAAAVARAMGVRDHRVIKLDLRAVGGSALTDEIEVPKREGNRGVVGGGAGATRLGEPGYPDSGVPITYVPARNMVFLSIAAGLSEVVGARDVFIGVNAVDYSGYPDCRPEFIRAFEAAANLGTKAGVEAAARGEKWFRVHAPLVKLSKAEIIRLGVSLGVDYGLTHSCYDPDEEGRACGRCDSCRLRAEGFREAGVGDPTRYA